MSTISNRTNPNPKKRRFHVMVAFALSLMLMLSTVFAAAAAPVAQEETESLTVSDILLNVTMYEGETVTVDGDADIASDNDNFFILDEQDELRLDRIVVLAPSSMYFGVEDEEAVRVTGTVQTFTGNVGAEVGLPLSEVIVESLQGRVVIVADSIQPETSMVGDDVVIQIGDTTISSSEFDQRFMKVVGMIAAGQGMPLNDETWQLFEGLRGEYLEQLATEEVLSAEAERRGIVITDEELQEQIDSISDRFESEEGFQGALVESGFADEDEFREFVRRNELLRRVGESLQSEIDVTDEDVRDFYDANPELFYTEDGPLAFEDVEQGIRTQLERQLFNAILLDLREDLQLRIFAENLNPMDEEGAESSQ